MLCVVRWCVAGELCASYTEPTRCRVPSIFTIPNMLAFDESDMPVVDYTSFMRCMCAVYQCGYLSLLAAPREDIGRRLREQVEVLKVSPLLTMASSLSLRS